MTSPGWSLANSWAGHLPTHGLGYGLGLGHGLGHGHGLEIVIGLGLVPGLGLALGVWSWPCS